MRSILLATSNPHKLEEVSAILAPLGIEAMGLDSLEATYPEPIEDADTFAGNARLKAIGYATATGRRCLADDSGLEVDAIGGAPGVHSARYSGTGDTRAERDAANNAKLLEAMAAVPDDHRAARFVCCMCLADPDGSIVAETQGAFEGVIGHTLRGGHGFGYDPLLILPEGVTSAELPPDEKNRRSHRAQATHALAAILQESTAPH
ncbi:MAG: RdgB/HAM1 family non-canonical purine NTP pyrophosphatase [Planctomycetes bacterium]|nr:RdgB/HAM1 family non-canonical purine NTP pyrophosphatase [Planctomycetota bacterium]MCP4839458.1 RdgB/HAM1 family non-canonical purine NTP pyrophosphatase [Planctomycetota bacterium]